MARRRRHHEGRGARGGRCRRSTEFAARANGVAGITPERVIRDGEKSEQILKLIDEDEDIAILVLAAGTGKEGPGPLVAGIGKTAGELSDPGRDRSGASRRRGSGRVVVSRAPPSAVHGRMPHPLRPMRLRLGAHRIDLVAAKAHLLL